MTFSHPYGSTTIKGVGVDLNAGASDQCMHCLWIYIKSMSWQHWKWKKKAVTEPTCPPEENNFSFFKCLYYLNLRGRRFVIVPESESEGIWELFHDAGRSEKGWVLIFYPDPFSIKGTSFSSIGLLLVFPVLGWLHFFWGWLYKVLIYRIVPVRILGALDFVAKRNDFRIL